MEVTNHVTKNSYPAPVLNKLTSSKSREIATEIFTNLGLPDPMSQLKAKAFFRRLAKTYETNPAGYFQAVNLAARLTKEELSRNS